MQVYNLSAPDSPRWNDYFVDLALEIGAVPVARIARRQLQADTRLAAPALKLLQLAMQRVGGDPRHIPEVFAPGLLPLFGRQLRLRSDRAERELGVRWTPYAQGLAEAVQWWGVPRRHPARRAPLAAP